MSINVKDYVNAYEFECDLPSDGRAVHFKPFTTGQMKKMLTYESSNDPFAVERILDDIINECVIDEGFHIDQLLLQDRFYLLLKIREKSKGDSYGYNYKCPECKAVTPGSVNISEMKVTPMDVDETPIKLTDKLSVKMKLITRGEQKEIYRLANVGKGTIEEKMSNVVTMSVAQSMDTFYADSEEDSDVSFEDKSDLVDNGIPTSGFETLKQWLVDNDYGIDFTVDITCMNPECKHEDVFDIPIDNFFD